METIYIANNLAVTTNDSGSWYVIQTRVNGHVMEIDRNLEVKVPLLGVNFDMLVDLYEAFKFSATTPLGLLPAIEKELEQRNAPVFNEMKKHIIDDIINNIVKLNHPTQEEQQKHSNREVLLKQIAEGLETNDNKDQVASLGYCSVVKKNADVKYRWSVITPRDMKKFGRVGDVIDYILAKFW